MNLAGLSSSVVAAHQVVVDLTVVQMARFFVGATAAAVLIMLIGGGLWVGSRGGEGLVRSTSRVALIGGVVILASCGLPALFFGVHGL